MVKNQLKKVIVPLVLAAIGMMYIPFAFSTNHSNTIKYNTASSYSVTPASSTVSALASMYDSLHLEVKGLSKSAFDQALKGFEFLKNRGKILNSNVLTIVDFSKPSYTKRLFVLDVKSMKLLYNTYVAHGQNSGREMAAQFSNIPESFQSSMGFYVTSGTYTGKNGYSMYLMGQEKGFNDNAYERAIVMHGAPYVSESFVKANGYLGRSWGCPAVPEALNKPIVNKIKGGSCLFIYTNKTSYSRNSRILNS